MTDSSSFKMQEAQENAEEINFAESESMEQAVSQKKPLLFLKALRVRQQKFTAVRKSKKEERALLREQKKKEKTEKREAEAIAHEANKTQQKSSPTEENATESFAKTAPEPLLKPENDAILSDITDYRASGGHEEISREENDFFAEDSDSGNPPAKKGKAEKVAAKKQAAEAAQKEKTEKAAAKKQAAEAVKKDKADKAKAKKQSAETAKATKKKKTKNPPKKKDVKQAKKPAKKETAMTARDNEKEKNLIGQSSDSTETKVKKKKSLFLPVLVFIFVVFAGLFALLFFNIAGFRDNMVNLILQLDKEYSTQADILSAWESRLEQAEFEFEEKQTEQQKTDSKLNQRQKQLDELAASLEARSQELDYQQQQIINSYADLDKVVAIYTKMSASEAAKALSAMDDIANIAAILSRMKDANAAAILGVMDAKEAAQISLYMMKLE